MKLVFGGQEKRSDSWGNVFLLQREPPAFPHSPLLPDHLSSLLSLYASFLITVDSFASPVAFNVVCPSELRVVCEVSGSFPTLSPESICRALCSAWLALLWMALAPWRCVTARSPLVMTRPVYVYFCGASQAVNI